MDYLIMFLSAKQPRRLRVIENILHNKRTVTTLFWGMRYHILPWLGSNKQLTRINFDAAIDKLVGAGLANVSQNQVLLTNTGKQAQLDFERSHYQPQFLQFYLLGDLTKIERRVLLAGQVLSEYSYHNKKYAPLSFDEGELLAVKRWFQQQDKQVVATEFKHELQSFLETLPVQQANFWTMQLVGHQTAGWSAEQAAEQLALSAMDADMMRRDLWAALTGFINERPGMLHELIRPLITTSPLSHSTQVTYDLYKQHRSISQISQYRHLKESTIREHLLEVAIFMPAQFSFETVLPAETMQQFSQQYVGDIDHWQFKVADKDDGQAFFYFRLFQIMRSYQSHD
ncbi:hypothetical protein LOOC260_111460 [Paucilactobacillus hokkaidonensis JCM 18461]|uniref:Helicase Helix-turn-helix domain-containing protein n=1 Tax=Paucilactobacillus hokkaidonensis JCM 18461 TaxID=1291742 RepID=A0A0A1GUP4_9LACO|nr:helix-turn-helix domain-containing protein [Paucilactobacillus hokkaidonensis]BAP85685.1 hypothetical protein LOOC260_111460 [Paucilactobacillus hokkaidonensis JCM 18461]